MVELIQHHAGADTDDAAFLIEFQNLSVVAREIHDEAFADGPAAQAGAGSARNHRHTRDQRRLNDVCRLLHRFGKRHRRRHDLVGRGVRGVKLERQIVERDLAVRGVERRHLLGGKHGHKLSSPSGVDNRLNDLKAAACPPAGAGREPPPVATG